MKLKLLGTVWSISEIAGFGECQQFLNWNVESSSELCGIQIRHSCIICRGGSRAISGVQCRPLLSSTICVLFAAQGLSSDKILITIIIPYEGLKCSANKQPIHSNRAAIFIQSVFRSFYLTRQRNCLKKKGIAYLHEQYISTLRLAREWWFLCTATVRPLLKETSAIYTYRRNPFGKYLINFFQKTLCVIKLKCLSMS